MGYDDAGSVRNADTRLRRVFVFTDIEGSTPLWEQQPAAMSVALARHDELSVAAIEANRGTIVKHLGDGYHAVFERAVDAVQAVTALQIAMHEEPWSDLRLTIRVGLHVGVAEPRRGDWFGRSVNLAARIMSAAVGGQVLISGDVADELAVDSGRGHDLRAEGSHELKGIAGAVELHSLLIAGLPAPRALAGPTSVVANLPIAPHELIGRGEEVAAITAALGDRRLVTLTGPPGTGKTRLVVDVAHRLAPEHSGGAHFVELAPLAEADAPTVLSAIADVVLGLDPLAEAGSGLARLADQITDATLVVLDNCEHLAGAVADAVTQTLQRVPQLTMLATSRTPIGVAGEQVAAIEPLDLGVDGAAVALFRQRARQANPVATDLDPGIIEALCQRLDGLPLAIELAAARLDVLTLEQLDDRLAEVLNRSRRSRGREERHATLDAAVRWSWDLLDADERSVLARASVFAGTFDLDAAAHVCGGDDFDDLDIIDLISALQDRSFIATVFAETGNRFRLLEAIRAFAASHLDDTETAIARRRHQDYYLRLSSRLAETFDEKPDPDVIAQIELDESNFEAALRLTGDGPEIRAARKLAMQMHTWWEETGRLGEGFDHARRLMTPEDPESSLWRAILGLAVTYSAMAGRLTDMADGEAQLSELVAGSPDIRAVNAYIALGFAGLARAEMIDAAEWFDTAAEVIGPFDGGEQRQVLMTAGACLAYAGQVDEATARYRAAREVPPPVQGWFEDYAAVFEASALVQADPAGADVPAACDLMHDALGRLAQRGLGFRVTVASHQAALAFALADRWDLVERWWPVTVEMARANGHRWAVGLAMELAAWCAAAREDDEAAARHWAVVDTVFGPGGFGLPAAHVEVRSRLRPGVEARLGSERLTAALADTGSLDLAAHVAKIGAIRSTT